MRRALFLLLLLLPREIQAAPTYGTETPHKGKFYIGYQNNAIFKHDLSDSYGNIKSIQNFLDFSYGISDRFTLDLKAGAGDLSQKGGIHPKVYYTTGFAGGYGFRVKVFEADKYKAKAVAGFHHISVHPNNRNINGDKYESLLDDWQFSLVGSKKIAGLSPFVGVKVSRCDLVYKVNEIDRKRRPPEYYVGLVVGCEAPVRNGFSVRVEGHFIDESALSTGVYYTY